MLAPNGRARETAIVPGDQLGPNVDIVIDCADPETLAGFWAAALGYRAVGFRGR